MEKLSDMANKLIVDNSCETEPVQYLINQPSLAGSMEDLQIENIQNIAVGLSPERKQGRIRDYLEHQNNLITVQNRLSSLVKSQSTNIKRKTLANKYCPFPPIIDSLEKCLDLKLLLAKFTEPDFKYKEYGIEDFNKVVEQV